jgi:hypothetical protein
MSRIVIPAIESATGATAEVYAQVRKVAGGGIPNLFAAVGALAPEALNAILNAEGALGSGTLSKQDVDENAADVDGLMTAAAYTQSVGA